jgi:hypothetical protein
MRLITHSGRTQSLTAWAKEIGIGRRALWNRLSEGWPLELALSAGKRELYKGKPALAVGSESRSLSSRGDLPEGDRPSNGKSFAANCLTASAPTPAHIQRPDKKHHRMGRWTRHLPVGSKQSPFPRLAAATSAILEKEAEGAKSNQLIGDPVVVAAIATWQVARIATFHSVMSVRRWCSISSSGTGLSRIVNTPIERDATGWRERTWQARTGP